MIETVIATAEPIRPPEMRYGRMTCNAMFFGRHWMAKEVDWRLPGKQSSLSQDELESLGNRLTTIAARNHFVELYAPYTDKCSALLKKPEAFKERNPLGPLTIWRGPQADIILSVEPITLAFTTAGCALIVAMDGSKVAVAHAGLKSLLRPTGKFHGVVDELKNQFREDAALWVFFAIRPEHFVYAEDDPDFGNINKEWRKAMLNEGYPEAMSVSGRIDLLSVIRAQTRYAGFLNTPARTPFAYLPPDAYTKAQGGRNLVLFQINRD